ncbi:MAG TPA: DUF4232 domain-containing protein [Streptosporangiaceae bacterium]|nr:DUF4232 domain-containing protein [Streptosporangiaceae bacterium]
MRCLWTARAGCPRPVAISAAALVALTGCATAAPISARHTATVPASGTATAGSPAAAQASGAAAIAARCADGKLRLAGGREGESETAIGFIGFTNTGSLPCTLRGYPQVALIWHGQRLPVRDIRPRNVMLRSAVLAPGKADAAQVMVQWQNWCGRRVRLLSARITIPGTGTLTMPFNGPPDWYYTPRCVQPGQPSELLVMQAYAST